MKNIMLAVLALFVVFTASACTTRVEQPVEAVDLQGPESCDLLSYGPYGQAWKFSNKDTAAPVGFECVSLGGGVFKCDPEACLVLPYTGSCPHCGGGGE
jgi:hypothetical protein